MANHKSTKQVPYAIHIFQSECFYFDRKNIGNIYDEHIENPKEILKKKRTEFYESTIIFIICVLYDCRLYCAPKKIIKNK